MLSCSCAIAQEHDSDGHGPGSAIAVLDGDAARDLARRWTSGSVLWVSKSP
ncbi:hypothetical protein [Bradyrhizobium sp. Cp5.3]|uniref:hypothetical protein n=1 Tax=Bradyrhizobium sp. Cp5.3 TaxID=443598 RepID=UPI00041B0D02|nr:hypothetical protein [Bradyrhizobium sp. Cp5.3]